MTPARADAAAAMAVATVTATSWPSFDYGVSGSSSKRRADWYAPTLAGRGHARRTSTIRSYLSAAQVAESRNLRRDADYDDDALFFATALHDLGLTDDGEARPDRLEIAGADLAVELIQQHAVSPEVQDTVWDAIALHTSPAIAQRRGIICDLTLAGTALNFGHDSDFLSDEEAAVINDAFPRLNVHQALGGSIIAQAKRNWVKAPHLSAADYFQRSAHGFDLSFISRPAVRNAWNEFIPFLDYDVEIRGDLFHERNRVVECTLPAGCARSWTLPERASRAEVLVPCDPQPGPDRNRPRPMDDALEARAERLRHHLR